MSLFKEDVVKKFKSQPSKLCFSFDIYAKLICNYCCKLMLAKFLDNHHFTSCTLTQLGSGTHLFIEIQ